MNSPADPTIRERLRELAERHVETRKPTMEPDPADPTKIRQTAYCQFCATSRTDEDPRWPCETARLLNELDTLERRAIAATELRGIVKSLVQRANGRTPQWAGDHRTYELHLEERFIDKARAALEASRGSA